MTGAVVLFTSCTVYILSFNTSKNTSVADIVNVGVGSRCLVTCLPAAQYRENKVRFLLRQERLYILTELADIVGLKLSINILFTPMLICQQIS